ncbi:MAG: hypothetical protein ACI9N0_001123 [Ilumatobacter sp.]
MIDLSSIGSVQQAVAQTLADLEEKFWSTEWTAKGLDTQAGREILISSINQVRQNVRSGLNWADRVDLVGGATSADA